MKSRLFIGILIVTHEYYLPIYLDSMAPYIKQIAKSFGHCLSDCKNKETSINLASKKQTNSRLKKEGVGGYFAIFLQVRSESPPKKGARFYHYHYIHPGVFFFFFRNRLFPASHDEGRVPSSESPLPSQSKLVFRKIDNSKASSSWMANFLSKNPGTQVPITDPWDERYIYIYARWWQLKYFPNNYPENWGNDSQFDEHIFQLVWFNHQLVKISGNVKGRLFFLWKLYSL